MTRYEFIQMLAAMDDDEFVQWAQGAAFTPKPARDDEPAESMSNFRERVVDALG